MTIQIDIADTDLADLLAKVEAGQEVVLARGDVPVAKITHIPPKSDVRSAIDAIFRIRAGLPPTTIEEILAWKAEGRR